jgi:hypothetical protein
MEKRSRRRTPDLVTQPASQGLSENEIGCARISMMARSQTLHARAGYRCARPTPSIFFTFGLQRTAGPYSWVNNGPDGPETRLLLYPDQRTSSDRLSWSVSCQERKSAYPIQSPRRRGRVRKAACRRRAPWRSLCSPPTRTWSVVRPAGRQASRP